MVQPLIRAELYEAMTVMPLAIRGPGTYNHKMQIEGGGLLSTLFVRSFDVGATVTVNWYESTTGEDQGEATLITSHTMPPAMAANKITLSSIHNKPYAVVTIAGGTVDFGLYATVYPASGSSVITGDVSILGLKNGGRVTEVTLNSVTWTALPAAALTDRNAIAVQNMSATEVKVNYDSTTVGYVGMAILASGGERQYDIQDDIILYGKSAAGSVSVNVEEIA